MRYLLQCSVADCDLAARCKLMPAQQYQHVADANLPVMLASVLLTLATSVCCTHRCPIQATITGSSYSSSNGPQQAPCIDGVVERIQAGLDACKEKLQALLKQHASHGSISASQLQEPKADSIEIETNRRQLGAAR